MEPDERPLPPGSSTSYRLRRELIRRGRRSDSLGKIAASVVALDEHASGIDRARGQPSVPNVRDEEGDVTRFGQDGDCTAAFPLQIVVGQPLQGGCLS